MWILILSDNQEMMNLKYLEKLMNNMSFKLFLYNTTSVSHSLSKVDTLECVSMTRAPSWVVYVID